MADTLKTYHTAKNDVSCNFNDVTHNLLYIRFIVDLALVKPVRKFLSGNAGPCIGMFSKPRSGF